MKGGFVDFTSVAADAHHRGGNRTPDGSVSWTASRSSRSRRRHLPRRRAPGCASRQNRHDVPPEVEVGGRVTPARV